MMFGVGGVLYSTATHTPSHHHPHCLQTLRSLFPISLTFTKLHRVLPLTPSNPNPRSRNWRRHPRTTTTNNNNNNNNNGTIIRSPSLVELEYADLDLKDMYGRSEVGHIRIRQHVNPLSSSFSQPVPAPDWKQVYKDCSLPLMVDIGCGSGRFLIWQAKYSPQTWNYLGLEIRQKLVQRSQFWVKDLSLQNIHFMSANATISFEQLVSSYPGSLIFVSVLCPDPYFKKRHHKRRVLQKPLVDSISKHLTTGGQVFLQSDVLEVAMDMRRQFDLLSDMFSHIDAIKHNILCDSDGWVLQNPMGIRTEREIHAELEGAKIYRRIYEKGGAL